MDWQDWNEAWNKIEAALADFDYIINKYGYTFATTAASGVTTMTVTAKDTSPAEASLVAEISQADGQTVIDLTTTIGETVTKARHALNSQNGEGGPINGI